jgi:hypothetical protein
VEFFDENQYLFFSSVAENLIFGAPNKNDYSDANLCNNQYFLGFLKQADLTRPLLSLGAELARQTVDILGSLPPDAIFFKQSPIGPEELDEFKTLVERFKRKKIIKNCWNWRCGLCRESTRWSPCRPCWKI